MKFIFTLTAFVATNCNLLAQSNQPLQPQLFQEGVISKGDYETHPAFTPSADTLYFVKLSYDQKLGAICVSYRNHDRWSAPAMTTFSGQYFDADPFVTKDGQSLYFMSNRPLKPGDPVRDNTDIWKVERTAAGWGQPIHLEAPVNSEADEYYPTLADNGNIYFGSPRKGGMGGSDIYRCRLVNGKYQPAENLGEAINTENNEYEGFIAPDESFLIFMATVPRGIANADFYISYRQDGVWSKAVKLPEPINSDGIEWSPKVTRDKKLFYFSSTRNRWTDVPKKPETIEQYNRRLEGAGNGLADIYTIPFSVIESLKNK